MTLDQAREFITFLRGKGPDGFRLPNRPRLGKRAAFTVLYVLQERFRLIPDTYEECAACAELFDTTESGGWDEKQQKHFCESCADHYATHGESDG